jgi:hypothetical protein
MKVSNFLFLLIFSPLILVAQSKKEEIVLLNNRIDSLTTVFNLENKSLQDELNKTKEEFKSENNKLQDESKALTNNLNLTQIELDKLKQSLVLLESQSNQVKLNKTKDSLILTKEITRLKESVKLLKQENEYFQTQLKIKTDSITLLSSEVKKYKPIEKAICTEKTVKVSGNLDPTIIETCTFRQYKFVTTSEADYKGRYSNFTEVFKKSGESYVKIENHDVFNSNQSELLSIINKNALKEYNELSADPENADCFQEQAFQEYESLDDVGIYIKDSLLGIYYSFGLGGACMSVDGGGMTLPISTIEKYLK